MCETMTLKTNAKRAPNFFFVGDVLTKGRRAGVLPPPSPFSQGFLCLLLLARRELRCG